MPDGSVRQVWGVGGGSGSGKSTLVGMFVAAMPRGTVTVLSFDAYYRDLSHLSGAARAEMNFDHPDALESELLLEHLGALCAGDSVAMPDYDFAAHTRLPGTAALAPAPIVLVEGILLYAFPALCERFDYKVFIDVPEAVRLERRIARDVVTRGRSEESVRAQFAATVAPMHWRFVQPGRDVADRVVEHGEDYVVVAHELAAKARGLIA